MAALINMPTLRTFSRLCCRVLKDFHSRNVITRRFKSDGFVPIASFLRDHPTDTDVRVKGWIKSIRKQKENTFLHISDGSNEQIQVVIPTTLLAPNCTFNSAVEVAGRLVKSPKPKQPVEVQGQSLSVLNSMDLDAFPFTPNKAHPLDYIRQHSHLRPKTNITRSILRLSSLITNSLQQTLISEGYVNIFTPILTSNDCEGSGEVFLVRPASDELCQQMSKRDLDEAFFDKKVYLTVSGQLHLEAMAGGLPKVFTLGPTFRAENSRSRRHLAEFRMLEAELAFCDDLQPLLSVMERLIKGAAKEVLDDGAKDLAVVKSYSQDVNVEDFLSNMLKDPFATLTYKDGMELLLKNRTSFKSPPMDGADLGSEHELFLVQKMGGRPTFLVDWPAEIKPFYMRAKDEDPSVVSCVDLLVPRVGELCGGSLREHRYDTLKHRLERLDLDQSLGWYLDLRRLGGPPTGGFGLGVERLISYLLNIQSVKDVTPFPRTPHHCPM